jgi:polar amino acid transport system substrate-binding protein
MAFDAPIVRTQAEQEMHCVQICRAAAALLFVGLVVAAGPAQRLAAQATPPDAEAAERQPKRVAIRFLTESDFPPFNYFDEDNVLTGFNVDIARAVCFELNLACDIQVRQWDQLLPALAKGEADAVVASHVVSPNTLKIVDFTDRYYFTPGRFAARRGAITAEVTPEGLEGKRIAVAQGTAHEAYLRTFFRDSNIRVLETVEMARDALIAGTADLLFDDGISLAYWLNGTSSRACCEFRGGPFAEPKFFGDGIGIAIKRDDIELKKQLNVALRRMRESGRYEELLLRYFPLRVF